MIDQALTFAGHIPICGLLNHRLAWYMADMTQQQALDSIRQGMGRSVDIQLLAWVGVLVLVIVAVLSFISRRTSVRQRAATLNNAGRLIKEVSREIDLKPAELKKLRALADQLDRSMPSSADRNPLLLLLCPSQLAKAMKKK